MRLWRHMRALWPRWTLLPMAPYYAFGAFAVARVSPGVAIVYTLAGGAPPGMLSYTAEPGGTVIVAFGGAPADTTRS